MKKSFFLKSNVCNFFFAGDQVKGEKINVVKVSSSSTASDKIKNRKTSGLTHGVELKFNQVDSSIFRSKIQEQEFILSHLLDFELKSVEWQWVTVEALLPDINAVQGNNLNIWYLPNDSNIPKEAKPDPTENSSRKPHIVYYKHTKESLKIITREPCKFVVTAKSCRDVELIVFAEVDKDKTKDQRIVSLYYFLCGVYDRNVAKQVHDSSIHYI